jgi:CRP-like cAMP-binding protein
VKDLPAEAPVADSLGRHALFADLPARTVAVIAASVTEQRFAEGEWVLQPGAENCGLHLILDGEAAVVLDDADRAVLHAGMFFGEISVLLDEPVGLGVVARSPLRCAVIDRDRLFPLLLNNPTVMLRLLQAEARRLSDANRWQA